MLTVNQFKPSLNNSAGDFVKFDEREKTILMFNKKESNKSTSRERFSDDGDFIKEFVSECLHLRQQDIQSFVRLCRYDASKRPRPLKIQNKSSQFNVMNNLSILKEAEDKYKSIAIS